MIQNPGKIILLFSCLPQIAPEMRLQVANGAVSSYSTSQTVRPRMMRLFPQGSLMRDPTCRTLVAGVPNGRSRRFYVPKECTMQWD